MNKKTFPRCMTAALGQRLQAMPAVGELESLIATRHKMGYMLNFKRENVLLLHKGDLSVSSALLLLMLDRFISNWSDWLLDVSEVLCLG